MNGNIYTALLRRLSEQEVIVGKEATIESLKAVGSDTIIVDIDADADTSAQLSQLTTFFLSRNARLFRIVVGTSLLPHQPPLQKGKVEDCWTVRKNEVYLIPASR